MIGERGRRISTDKPSLSLIQVLRGVAALMVVVHHATTLAQERLAAGNERWLNGAAGVDIFFVISGFVMALSSKRLAATSMPALEFLKRRVERIVPLYWIVTTAKLSLVLLVPGMAVNALGSRFNIIASYLFLPSRNSAGLMLPVLVVGWTLNFEMMFYVMFAVALAFRMRPLWFLIPAMGGLAALSLLTHGNDSGAMFYCNSIVIEFVFGLLLYSLFERGLVLSPILGGLSVAAGFAAIFLVPQGFASQARGLIWGLPALAIVAGALGLERRVGALVPAWLRELGDGSYSLYLTHGFALPVAATVLLRLHVQGKVALVPTILVATALSLITGEFAYRWVERPILQYFGRNRFAIAAQAE